MNKFNDSCLGNFDMPSLIDYINDEKEMKNIALQFDDNLFGKKNMYKNRAFSYLS